MRSLPRISTPRLALALVAALGAVAFAPSCRSTVPNREPLLDRLPSVTGESLDSTVVRLPEDLAGEPAVLLIGYVQDAQFDADRWLLGLLQAEVDVAVYEVPTIRGMVPGLIAGKIDAGMRAGIPSEDWASVVTLYKADAKRIVEFTGNERPRNMRVLLLDAEGRLRWMHDRGYSPGQLLELVDQLEQVRAE